MGLTRPSAYTEPMPRDFPPEYQCGDLRISPSLGTITGASGASVRLGLVNMKVLETLLARAGDVVSRGDLFKAVWKNQVVSDDALTRCIADIRSELRVFSGRDDWIETLPKRGYRWLGTVREVKSGAPGMAEPLPVQPQADAAPRPLVQRIARLCLRGTLWLGAPVVMALALVSVIDRITSDRAVVVALLPATASAGLAEQAAEFDLALTDYLMQIDGVRVLSPSAIESRPANPFPFFAYEFGARWLIEADLRETSGSATIVLTLADARTGIAEMRVSSQLADPPAAFEALLEFIGSTSESRAH
jgi:DNA-binding winged helix-turn-helix (wHTH) protein